MQNHIVYYHTHDTWQCIKPIFRDNLYFRLNLNLIATTIGEKLAVGCIFSDQVVYALFFIQYMFGHKECRWACIVLDSTLGHIIHSHWNGMLHSGDLGWIYMFNDTGSNAWRGIRPLHITLKHYTIIINNQLVFNQVNMGATYMTYIIWLSWLTSTRAFQWTKLYDRAICKWRHILLLICWMKFKQFKIFWQSIFENKRLYYATLELLE